MKAVFACTNRQELAISDTAWKMHRLSPACRTSPGPPERLPPTKPRDPKEPSPFPAIAPLARSQRSPPPTSPGRMQPPEKPGDRKEPSPFPAIAPPARLQHSPSPTQLREAQGVAALLCIAPNGRGFDALMDAGQRDRGLAHGTPRSLCPFLRHGPTRSAAAKSTAHKTPGTTKQPPFSALCQGVRGFTRATATPAYQSARGLARGRCAGASKGQGSATRDSACVCQWDKRFGTETRAVFGAAQPPPAGMPCP